MIDLLLVHVAVRYLHLHLFGSVTYRGLAPIVPWLVLGSYVALLALLAVSVARRVGPSTLALGVGILLFAVEPFTILNGGCGVGRGAGSSSAFPGLVWDGLVLVVTTPDGACSMYLNTPILGMATFLLGGGLWFASVTDAVVERLLSTNLRWMRVRD